MRGKRRVAVLVDVLMLLALFTLSMSWERCGADPDGNCMVFVDRGK